jgi:hypothetical protein
MEGLQIFLLASECTTWVIKQDEDVTPWALSSSTIQLCTIYSVIYSTFGVFTDNTPRKAKPGSTDGYQRDR